MKLDRLILLAVCCLSLTFPQSLLAQSTFCLNLDLEWEAGGSLGDTSCVAVRVRNFGDIIGMQNTYLYDGTALEFAELISGELGVSASNYHDFSAGVLTFSWVQPNLQPLSIADEAILYSICFKVIDDSDPSLEISFGDSPTTIEFVEAPTAIIKNYGLVHGGIEIGAGSTPPSVASSCVTSIACSQNGNGSIDLEMIGSGPFTFAWSGPNGFTATTEDIDNLEIAGKYDVTVTDASGVERQLSFQVSYEEEVTVLLNVQADLCGGTGDGSLSAVVAGGMGTYSYLWSTGATDAVISDLVGGTYSVTVTSDQTSCVYIESAEVPSISSLVASVTITNASCQSDDGRIDLEISAPADQLPVSYLWSNGATTEDLLDIPTGSYEVTVTGTNCSASYEFAVGTSELLIDGQVNQADCQNNLGAITLTTPAASGPYSYAWSNGAITRDLSDIPPGTYTVTVTNTETGCENEKTFVLNPGELLAAWTYECTVFTDTTLVELTTILWNPSALPVYYSYSDGSLDTTHTLTEASSIIIPENQSYAVTITDGNGCQTILNNINVNCDGNNQAVNLKISPTTNQVDVTEAFCLSVRADNFTNITSAQFSLAWDPGLLSFTGVSDNQLPGNVPFHNQTPQDILDGRLRVAWVIDDVANGHTLPDNSPLFDICFTALAEGQTSVSFTEEPIPIEITNNQPQILTHNTADALVNIGAQGSAEAALRLAGVTVENPDPLCVPVIADEFSAIIGMQGTISWDETVLDFDSLGLLNLPGLNQANFNLNIVAAGQLTYSWTEPSLSPFSATSGDLLFSICFTPLVAMGYSDVSFSNNPTLLEIVAANNQQIVTSYTNGFVAITDNIVWPGDTDQNETVDHFDLLNIGLGFGQTGAARPQATSAWIGQYAPNWNESTPETNINFHHADTDGDGIVTAADVDALELNWGEITDLWTPTSGQQRHVPFAQQLNSAPLYVQPATVELGATVPFKIIYGEENNLAEDVYGIAFSITYDPDAVVAGSVSAGFDNSWLGTINDNLLAVARDYPDENRLDIAITRTDGESIDGSGQIATMYITIEDVIFRNDIYEMNFTIDNVRAITHEELGIHTNPQLTTSIIDISTDTDEPGAFAQLRILPNPVTDILYLNLGDLIIEHVDLIHLSGRQMATYSNVDQISVSQLPAGIYFLQFTGPAGRTTRRFIKQ